MGVSDHCMIGLTFINILKGTYNRIYYLICVVFVVQNYAWFYGATNVFFEYKV